MASTIEFLTTFALISLLGYPTNAQLLPSFYSRTCPNLQQIVRDSMKQAIAKEARMGASILRLFFHDCFVNGCDASILLDNTPTFIGEKNAFGNINSARGFEVIDTIKSNVEAACNGTVSCADILALASQEAVFQLGGPSWSVQLGRRDARTASLDSANRDLPSPFVNLDFLISSFSNHGLNPRDMTALSGAHTLGQAQCFTFRQRIYGERNINSTFATLRQATCPITSGTGDHNLAPLDTISANRFDNGYFQDLVSKSGLLHTDQELFNGGSQDELVRLYSVNYKAFADDFVNAMVKMGNITPLTGTNGEIRKNCRFVN